MSKKKEGFVDFSDLDPAIDAIVNQGRQHPDGRGRAGHAGQVGVDKRGVSKATFNISTDTQAIITRLAQQQQLSKANIVEAAIAVLDGALRAKKVDLDPFKSITYSEKQPWRAITELKIPEEFDFFS
jgi:hypothetical protein